MNCFPRVVATPCPRHHAAGSDARPPAGWRHARSALLVALGCACLSVAAQTLPADTNEAAALYTTHCRACHTDQVHWRDAKRARDWDGLVREVGRWQTQLGLNWSGREVRAVARHLNRLYYRFPTSEGRVVGQLDR